MGRVYSKAPIIEAVIELRTRHAENVTLDDLARIHGAEATRYPVLDKRLQVDNRIEVTDGEVSSQIDHRQLGFVFKSADELQIIHATVQGFLFSRLAPYPNWEPFVEEAWRVWQKYRQEAKPEALTRVGVRFINRINVPSDSIEIKDYLRTYPELSGELPQVLSGYFMQVQVPLRQFDGIVNITSGIENPGQGLVSLILDVDCFRDLDLSLSAPDFDEEVRAILWRQREAKNFVFESCITDATRELIS
ncbi:TIGR04255 family protein [Micromonospora sp. U56]|uniref:TIGR04255 family protein n=1 Tax=Micromonospora sp. U56 TaxID=2824900 RepID=UPI001B37D429|nr:TIGR04255 family protein [Micromonospora sp. U56]MBQ0894298.1 TIGR04255 family protein [Micromonospora sp. U56]